MFNQPRLGPCLTWGIRSNGERAVTAVVSFRSIPPRWTSVSHSLFYPAQPECRAFNLLCALYCALCVEEFCWLLLTLSALTKERPRI